MTASLLASAPASLAEDCECGHGREFHVPVTRADGERFRVCVAQVLAGWGAIRIDVLCVERRGRCPEPGVEMLVEAVA